MGTRMYNLYRYFTDAMKKMMKKKYGFTIDNTIEKKKNTYADDELIGDDFEQLVATAMKMLPRDPMIQMGDDCGNNTMIIQDRIDIPSRPYKKHPKKRMCEHDDEERKE